MERNTPQRQAIQRVFEEHDRPLQVAEILEFGRKHASSLNQATVYRNLNRLVREGWIRRIEFPPLGTLYERSGKPHHHHFHCRRCDRLLELAGCGLDADGTTPPGFVTEGHELFLYGLCQECAADR